MKFCSEPSGPSKNVWSDFFIIYGETKSQRGYCQGMSGEITRLGVGQSSVCRLVPLLTGSETLGKWPHPPLIHSFHLCQMESGVW